VVDDDGHALARTERPTDRTDPWPGLAALVTAALEGTSAHRPVAVGVGCGGPMRAGGELVSPPNIPGWRDFPLRPRLAELTGLPVVVDNDAKALALGEGWCGAAQGSANFLAMVVSTGVGGGIVLDGRLLDGADGNAGHVGHLVVEPDGRPCPCGSRGCLRPRRPVRHRGITGQPPADAARGGERTPVGRAGRRVRCSTRPRRRRGSVALGFRGLLHGGPGRLDRRARISFARARIVPCRPAPTDP
jgi:glucokinase